MFLRCVFLLLPLRKSRCQKHLTATCVGVFPPCPPPPCRGQGTSGGGDTDHIEAQELATRIEAGTLAALRAQHEADDAATQQWKKKDSRQQEEERRKMRNTEEQEE